MSSLSQELQECSRVVPTQSGWMGIPQCEEGTPVVFNGPENELKSALGEGWRKVEVLQNGESSESGGHQFIKNSATRSASVPEENVQRLSVSEQGGITELNTVVEIK
ncbi:MAG: hypothetical protein KDI11_01070 [Alphaproteobacteria bacterium]|nr:hypothetical protein [Alphaproteobacteria bacterium]